LAIVSRSFHRLCTPCTGLHQDLASTLWIRTIHSLLMSAWLLSTPQKKRRNSTSGSSTRSSSTAVTTSSSQWGLTSTSSLQDRTFNQLVGLSSTTTSTSESYTISN
jgi:hypothetical protein